MNGRAWAALTVLGLSTAAWADAPKPRVIKLEVTEAGFVPNKLKAHVGEALQLRVTRKTEKTCATEIVIPDLGVTQELPLNKAVDVPVTPDKAGKLVFGCAMGMITGAITVE